MGIIIACCWLGGVSALAWVCACVRACVCVCVRVHAYTLVCTYGPKLWVTFKMATFFILINFFYIFSGGLKKRFDYLDFMADI